MGSEAAGLPSTAARDRRTEDLSAVEPITAWFTLEPDEVAAVEAVLGFPPPSGTQVIATRSYGGALSLDLVGDVSSILAVACADVGVDDAVRETLQVEKAAWSARERVADIRVTVINNAYSAEEIAGAEFASERRGMRSNVEDQQGWLVLSPRAEQLVVHTGHAVEESDPTLVVNAILAVVDAARSAKDAQ